jgi:sugar phosphate isomerase/epimerase
MGPAEDMTLAVKCYPTQPILDAAAEAGMEAVELYTSVDLLRDVDAVAGTCSGYPFRYAVHAPGEGYEPEALASLVGRIGAEVVVFHDIYFQDEWEHLVGKLRPLGCKLCLENVLSAVDTVKYMRRFGLGRCLDLEHLILETSGIFEEPLLGLMKQSAHVHMTGYVHGSRGWHTHFHHAPAQSTYLLDLLQETGYCGMVVSEAREDFQTAGEFRALNEFFRKWKDGGGNQ